MKRRFDVDGMTCAACVGHVEKAVRGLDGVDEVTVNLLAKEMAIEGEASDDAIVAAVKKAGYAARPQGGAAQESQEQENGFYEDYLRLRRRFLISLLFMIPLMVIAMGPMMGLPELGYLKGVERGMHLALCQLFLTLPVLYVNREYFIRGFTSLWHRVPNMDSLIALGSSAAFIYGVVVIFRLATAFSLQDLHSVHHHLHDLYFESATMILTLITLGKTLEARAKGRTGDAIAKLMDLAPKRVKVYRDNVWQEIDVKDMVKGDRFLVVPGGQIPVDGRVAKGESTVDESALTGESLPVEKGIDDVLMAGTTNLSGSLEAVAEKVGEDTSLANIIRLVREAGSSKAPIAKLADQVSAIFVPTVLGIALLTFLVWLFVGKDFSFSLSRAIAVLVISCPCALGLATPVAIMVGTGRGASLGVLYKDAEAMEKLHKGDTGLFDKTGTITKGSLEVTDSILSPEDASAVVAMESKVDHPLAKAVVRDIAVEMPLTEDPHVEVLTGRGVRALIDGEEALLGNLRLMEERGILLGDLKEEISRLSDEGKSVMIYAKGPKARGVLGLADTLKRESGYALEALKKRGLHTELLTGDHEKTARAIAKDLPLDEVRANLLPEDKERIVREEMEKGSRVAMVGDGINDAPALARADVGVAIGAGTDIALESAEIVLVRSSLLDFLHAYDLSGAVIKNIKENLFWAFFYNVIGIPIAAGVFYPHFGLTLNPMIAALAMSFSSVFVVTNALRLNFFRPKDEVLREVAYEEKESEKGEPPMKHITLHVDGMSCGHCKKRVEDAIAALGAKAEVTLDTKEVAIEAPEALSEEAISKAIADAGYTVL